MNSKRAKLIAEANSVEETQRFNELYSLIYEDLRRIASSLLRKEARATVNSVALVNEAWIRLRDAPQLAATSRAHFNAIAARVMRHFLVDYARQKNAEKRGGPRAVRVTIDESGLCLGWRQDHLSAQLLDLDRALGKLSARSSRQAEVAEQRLYSDLTNAEIAKELGLGLSTVERDWRVARAFLIKELTLPDSE